MAKILLFRAQHELSARLVPELSRAGYDVEAPESADVRTVLEHQPDLILLQTDVRTLDCCGLLTQLKGNDATAPVKIILLADGGALERSRALDLGADDVLSIPFEPAELAARIRAQLREKAPDDRLRQEVLEAKAHEHEAEAALAAIVAQKKESGGRRWIAIAVVVAVALIGVVITARNAQVTRKSNANLALQLDSLRSQILTQDQLLERVQKSRELDNRELTASVGKQLEALRAESAELRKQISTSSGGPSLTDLDSRLKQTYARIGKLESESRIAEEIVRDYSNSVCLIYAIVGFHERTSGARLKFAGIDSEGRPEVDAKGNVIVTTEGGTRPVQLHVFGSGFLVDNGGHVLTNHHVLQPWWHNQELPVPTDKFQPVLESIWAYFPGFEMASSLHVDHVSEDFDLGLASVELPANHPRPVNIEQQTANSGSPVVLIGYPTGIEGILARIDERTLKQIAQTVGNDTEGLVQELGKRKLIRPIVTQGHLGVVGPDRLVYDAQTTHGGSGGPVFNASGKVIGVNFAILSDFSGSNFAVPIARAAKIVAR